MIATLCTVLIELEEDIVAARRRAREVAALLGFGGSEQSRIGTAVSEIARNAWQYAAGGKAEFLLDQAGGRFTVRIADLGPGIPDLEEILHGSFRSRTGMGIPGARRLVDDFRIETSPGRGTTVELSRLLPVALRLAPQQVDNLSAGLARPARRDVVDELRHQDRELLRLMDELRALQEQLGPLNADPEENAGQLRRAGQMRSRFLSHISHEFRTPLASILALTRLLLDGADGTLSSEQQKQVGFIRKSGESLLEVVNDLLDLSSVEAGKSVVRPSRFHVSNLLGGLRSVLRPLLVNDAVELVFEDSPAVPPFYTDESKVSRILRNLVSNALEFTERGEVRVSARLNAAGTNVIFSVADTGIGIEQSDLELIFPEFSRLETPLQQRFKGTGLGLPLAKGLAGLLGGTVSVESTPGKGSTFFAEIPLEYAVPEPAASPALPLVLIVDDEEVSRHLIRQALGASFVAIEAGDGPSALEAVRRERPDTILLDLWMPGMDGFEVLRELEADQGSRDIPVIVISSKTLAPAEAARFHKRVAAVFSKEELSEPDGGERLRTALAPSWKKAAAGAGPMGPH
jgi:signal transduction histidine kinase